MMMGSRNPNSVSATPGYINQSQKRMTTAPAAVMSKTFENYIRAREKAEKIAKDKVEHLNQLALQKIKNQKKAERAMKDMNTSNKQRMET